MPFCLISEIIRIIKSRHEADLNIILPRVNNFDIKQKNTWNIYFMSPTPNKIWDDNGLKKTQQILVKTQVFVRKSLTTTYLTAIPSKPFYIIFVDMFF